ncbi:hypothetical protein PVAG01_08637 [Phlyctema vagabunda]|uniref:SH3 domain-containing protein n=1 Tax=Phlyctema vagabunda TaxID=108571 RepID=A0ABR4P9Y9_9HELO
MSGEFIAPVKSITKAFENGVKLARRVIASANDASAAQTLKILESAQHLQKSLESDSQAVSDAYRQGMAAFGESFNKTLAEDDPIQRKFKELRVELIDQINDCPDFEDDPDSFEPAPFEAIVKHSKTCRSECVSIFKVIQDRLGRRSLQEFGDRTQLHSIRETLSRADPTPPPVPPKPVPVLQIQTTAPIKPRSAWSIDHPPNVETSPVTASTIRRRPLSGDVSPLNTPLQNLIPRELVEHRLSANDEFLERRRRSRSLWQDQFRQTASPTPSEEGPGHSSPVLATTKPITIPLETPTSVGTSFSHAMTRDQSQTSHATRSSITSSLLQDIPERPRHGSAQSQELFFGPPSTAPLSPPLSENGRPAPEWGAIATTLFVPGFGTGVEDGLEVVSPVDHSNGLILANENGSIGQHTPATSLTSIDCPMRHDASFYKLGGFCEGARAILRGDEWFKVTTRPDGLYTTIPSAKCIKCSFEVNYKNVMKDQRLDRAGTYGNSGLRWRQRFITKSHLKTSAIDKPLYACIFCIEEHKTVEEHDATVFFSVPSLFAHLAKHSRPLPNVRGINVIYGLQPPEIVDFDIHFPSNTPTPSEFGTAQIAAKIATRPAAYATATHHPKTKHSTSTDPNGQPSLHFAIGARIVGVTFPNRFMGEWCIGYHDGQKGSFPASSIMLDTPVREDVLMNPQSTLFATARWDFKPKDTKDGTWLKFSKGDRISNIGYTFQDQWCWSGQTSKGKWGLFPAAFVEGLREGSAVTPSSSPSSISGLVSRMSFGGPLRRSSGGGRAERSASIRSNGSAGSPNEERRRIHPGLELATGSGGFPPLMNR